MNSATQFIADMKALLGASQVLTSKSETYAYRNGFRCGSGQALAVLRPRSLLDQWRALQACVATNKIIIIQAANTGLTGGSTPFGADYDRDVVIISTTYLSKLYVIDDGQQVICLPGTTLYQLEEALAPYGREPHSVIGSSCIGASVVGGICNNSGGALIRRGPAYTQMALFARVNDGGRLELVNHLGVRLGDRPEEILDRLERGQFQPTDIMHDVSRCGSDRDYVHRIREINSDVPARFNANPERLFEASGCAGKVVVFAVRLDTFAKERETRVFYIGTQRAAELTALRQHILTQFENLPVAGEYMHRDMFDVAAIYGKDTFLSIQYLGTQRLPRLFALKRQFDTLLERLGLPVNGSSDRLLQLLSRLFPTHLPARMLTWRDRFEHHLMLKMSGPGITEAACYLSTIFPSAAGDYFECTDEEADKAFLHRFVAAGAAIRYRTIHSNEVEDILALDIALPRNERDWFEVLPREIREQLHAALYYGHFFCHVFHQDYVVRKHCSTVTLKDRICRLLDARGAEYPAEHNVGHLYPAKSALARFYRSLDPCNQFNPGIGNTSKRTHWAAEVAVSASPRDQSCCDESSRRRRAPTAHERDATTR